MTNQTFIDMAVAKEHQNTLERDAWMEAVYGGRLRFQCSGNIEDVAEARPDYWSGVYKRWAQLYARDRWRSVMG
jgi:hypothetical protein